MSTEIARPRRRRRRWLLGIALGVVAFVIVNLLVTWIVFEMDARRGRQELSEVIAQTDEADPRWRWEEIDADRSVVPEAKNSIRVLREMDAALGGKDVAHVRLPDGGDLKLDGPANRKLDEPRLAAIRAALAEHERALALAVSLKDYPRGRAAPELLLNPFMTLLPYTDHCRSAFWLLQMDSERLLHDGQSGEVAIRLCAILHAAAGLRDDPFLVTQLVRMAGRRIAVRGAERLLGVTVLPDEPLRRLQGQFRAERGENLLLAGIRGDRAAYHQLFENLEQRRLSFASFMAQIAGNENSKPDLMLRASGIVYQFRLFEDHAAMLRHMNEAARIARLPHAEQMSAWDVFDLEAQAAKAESKSERRRIIATLLVPAVHRVGEAALRDHAMLSCADCALAAERFRVDHQRWPRTLDELRPKYLDAVPRDPFDGQPLRFAHRDGGVVIYSVGKDGEDDGGHVLDAAEAGGGNYDPGVRLWPPEQRGLPPNPPDEPE